MITMGIWIFSPADMTGTVLDCACFGTTEEVRFVSSTPPPCKASNLVEWRGGTTITMETWIFSPADMTGVVLDCAFIRIIIRIVQTRLFSLMIWRASVGAGLPGGMGRTVGWNGCAAGVKRGRSMFSGVVLVGAGDGLADFFGIEVGELLLSKGEGVGFGDAGTVGVAGE